MSGWDWDSLDIINYGHLQIVKPGPLRAPIKTFSLRRNDKLELILETRTAEDATSSAPQQPSGMVRMNTDTVSLSNGYGFEALAGGVQPFRFATSQDYARDAHELKETSRISYIEAKLPTQQSGRYTIDWLENIHGSNFVWPHAIKTRRSTNDTRSLGHDSEGVTLTDSDAHESFSRSCIRFVVAGIEMYLCASWQEPTEGRIRPGCLIYLGTPDEGVRTRIRNAISFSLGMYLVHLGHTVFSDSWEIVSFKSVSSYSIDRRVFDLVILPPAPLGPRFQHEIHPDALSRMVGAIYSHYDDLKFGDLNWAYWHALCATPHIAPVHFGAAIEALQRRYLEQHPEHFQTKLIPDRTAWNAFAEPIRQAISELNLSEADKEVLRTNVGGLNHVPRRIITEQLLAHLGITLGKDEAQAWRRRHDAAHGNDMKAGTELEVIRDTKLLRVLFHRILLRVTNACDTYYDYCTGDFPTRNLSEPVPSP